MSNSTLKPAVASARRDRLDDLAADHEEAAHRVGDLGAQHPPAQPVGEPAAGRRAPRAEAVRARAAPR